MSYGIMTSCRTLTKESFETAKDMGKEHLCTAVQGAARRATATWGSGRMTPGTAQGCLHTEPVAKCSKALGWIMCGKVKCDTFYAVLCCYVLCCAVLVTNVMCCAVALCTQCYRWCTITSCLFPCGWTAVGDDDQHLLSEVSPLSDKLPDGCGKFYFASGRIYIHACVFD
jgi:hypothetical protein